MSHREADILAAHAEFERRAVELEHLPADERAAAIAREFERVLDARTRDYPPDPPEVDGEPSRLMPNAGPRWPSRRTTT